MLFGDILCNNSLIEAYKKQDNTYDFTNSINNISNFLKENDFNIGFLGNSLLESRDYTSITKYNAPRELTNTLKDNKINILSLSTKHIWDYKHEGMLQTDKYLQEQGINTVRSKL